MADIRQILKEQSKEWLADRLVELSLLDSTIADRLELSLVAEAANEQDVAATFREHLDIATAEIEHHGPATGTAGIATGSFDAVADALTIVLSKNLTSTVLELSEYALLKLDRIFDLQDECELEYLVDAFRHLHLECCYRLKLDPVTLGRHLGELARSSEWGFFDGPPAGYSEVLGQKGLSAFQHEISATRSES